MSRVEPEPYPFCGQTGKVWREEDGAIGGDAITHSNPDCPARGMHPLPAWNRRFEQKESAT